MTTKVNVKEILEAIGIIAVVISLIFVGYQLQQSNRIAERDARAEIVANHISLNAIVLENSELAELLGKHRTYGIVVNSVEAEQSRRLADLWFQLWASVVVAYESGYLPERLYRGYLGSAISTIEQYPGMESYFNERIGNLGTNTETPSDFWKIVSDQINAEPR